MSSLRHKISLANHSTVGRAPQTPKSTVGFATLVVVPTIAYAIYSRSQCLDAGGEWDWWEDTCSKSKTCGPEMNYDQATDTCCPKGYASLDGVCRLEACPAGTLSNGTQCVPVGEGVATTLPCPQGTKSNGVSCVPETPTTTTPPTDKKKEDQGTSWLLVGGVAALALVAGMFVSASPAPPAPVKKTRARRR